MKIQFNSRPSIVLVSLALISGFWLRPSFSQTETSNYTQFFPQTAELTLTPEQETEIAEIAQSTKTQIMGLLTPAQQQQLEDDLAQGKALRDSLFSLGLSRDQRNQMRSTMQSSLPQLQAVLTPEQLEQLESQRGGGLRRQDR